LPDLRSSYTRFERVHEPSDDHQRAALMSELDEIVDATNGLATVAGIESVDDDPAPPVEATPT
jgi:hypothetical protein